MSPTYAEVSRRANELITERDHEWAGIPMPLPGLSLTLETKHPWAEKVATLQGILDEEREPDRPVPKDAVDADVLNSWWSTRLQ